MTTFCTTTCTPCPPPVEGHGRGASKCEQNGLCQRIKFDDLPRVKIESKGDGRFSILIERKPHPLLDGEQS